MPRSSMERGEEAPYSVDDSEQGVCRPNNVAPFTPSSSFFIIHESTGSMISPSGGSTSPPKLRRKGDESGASASIRARKKGLSSSGLRKNKSRSKTSSSVSISSNIPATQLNSSSALSPIAYDENEASSDQPAAKTKHAVELSLLNRCGSAPDLPIYSPLSANVYSSAKKRALQDCTNSASPHLATLQRSRLTPLPQAVVKQKNVKGTIDDTLDFISLHSKDLLVQEKLRQDAHTIASLKERLVLVEREISASTKYRHMTEKQIAQLSLENQRLQSDKSQQHARLDELDKTVLRQRHDYDKLAARYAAVYANLQKLVDQQQNPAENSAQQSALQALARENQDFLRKLRVLETRHTEDKTLTSSQDKKMKRLEAEIEALQHMHQATNRIDDLDDSVSDTDHVSRLAKAKRRTEGDNTHGGRPNSASSSGSISSSTPSRASSSARVQSVQMSPLSTTSHLVTAEAYQYIDPNILKVLGKVDSQFSITNAINLSVVLKKWLNSCVHIVCSTQLLSVQQTLLKRMCELLHCEHATLFTVDHASRKLVATCSERGPERWELPLDKGITGYAARHNTLCNVPCANDDPRFYSPIDSITGTTSKEVLALPIVHELQLFLETNVVSGEDNTNVNSLGVFAVLRAWNTTHQKPFSANDQILGTLLAIQAGIILRQTAVTKTLQKINHKTHQIMQMPSVIIAKALTSPSNKSVNVEASTATLSPLSLTPVEYPGAPAIPSVVQLVAVAQKELGECLAIKQLRIFVLDAAAHKLWHVAHDSDDSSPTVVRRYVSAQASLCALLLRSDATSLILPEPSAETAFNDTVDIPGGARGLYLVPILSPWGDGTLPFGMVQVSRVAKARLSASAFALTSSERPENGAVPRSVSVTNEWEAAQQTEDRLMLELLALFCRVFAGVLHHVAAQQLYDTCPSEIIQAQLATLTDHLDSLESRRKQEEEDDEPLAVSTTTTSQVATAQLDHFTSSRQSGRHASATTVRTTTPSCNVRLVASAEPKRRAAPESLRATSSPATSSSYPSAIDVAVPAAPDIVDVVPDACTNGNDNEDQGDTETNTEHNDPELHAPGPEQQPTESDAETSWPAVSDTMESYDIADALAPPPDDWAAVIYDGNDYAAAQYEDQLGTGSTWSGSDTYDPILWPAEENPVVYDEGVAWDDGNEALKHKDEGDTGENRGDSHRSTSETGQTGGAEANTVQPVT